MSEAVCFVLHHSRRGMFCGCPTLRDASLDHLVKVATLGSLHCVVSHHL